MEQHHREIADKVRQWYGYWDIVPRFETTRFAQFCARSSQLARYVSGKDTVIRLSQDMSACAEHSTDSRPNVVWIPQAYFSVDFFEASDPKLQTRHALFTEIALAIFNGSMVHEARHIRYSPPTIGAILELNTLGRNAEAEHLNIGVLAPIANIIEDLFIDARDAAEPYQWFVDAKNEVFFPTYVFEDRAALYISLAEEDTVPPTVVATVLNDLLVFAKNGVNLAHKMWQHTPVTAQICTYLDEARNAYDVAERANMAFLIYDLIMNDIPKDEQDGVGNQTGDMDSPLGMTSGNGTESNVQIDPEMVQKMLAQTSRLATSFSKIIATEIEGGKVAPIVDPHVTHVPPVVQRDINALAGLGDSTLAPSQTFNGFGQMLRKLKSRNHTHGPASNRGAIIKSRLHRIASDGMVCGKRVEMMLPEEIEVVMLGDASGSMKSNLLLRPTIEAVWGAYNSIKQAGNAVSAYFHSTQGENDDDEPVVYTVASHKMGTPLSGVEQRFQRVWAIEANCNFDGFAIQHMATKFTPRVGRKVLIVFSDGTPNGRGYRSDMAIDHTQTVVKQLRRRGIEVFSISLSEDVVHDNDLIYGKAYNIDATRDIAEQVKNLIAHIEQS